MSALLRAILYSDDPVYGLDAYRKLDPITTGEAEVRFLQAVEALFTKGVSHRWTGCTADWLMGARLASRVGSRDPGRDGRVEPFDGGRDEVFWCERAVSASGESV